MDSENSVLKTLFPPEFWELSEEDWNKGGLPYGFAANEALLSRMSVQYILASILGKKVQRPGHAEARAVGEALVSALKDISLLEKSVRERIFQTY